MGDCVVAEKNAVLVEALVVACVSVVAIVGAALVETLVVAVGDADIGGVENEAGAAVIGQRRVPQVQNAGHVA